MNYLVPVQIGAPDKFSNYLRLFNTMLSFRRLFSVVQSPQRLRAYLAGLWLKSEKVASKMHTSSDYRQCKALLINWVSYIYPFRLHFILLHPP